MAGKSKIEKKPRLTIIDFLRGIAAIGIVMTHNFKTNIYIIDKI